MQKKTQARQISRQKLKVTIQRKQTRETFDEQLSWVSQLKVVGSQSIFYTQDRNSIKVYIILKNAICASSKILKIPGPIIKANNNQNFCDWRKIQTTEGRRDVRPDVTGLLGDGDIRMMMNNDWDDNWDSDDDAVDSDDDEQ